MSHQYHLSNEQYRAKTPNPTSSTIMQSFTSLPDLFRAGKTRKAEVMARTLPRSMLSSQAGSRPPTRAEVSDDSVKAPATRFLLSRQRARRAVGSSGAATEDGLGATSPDQLHTSSSTRPGTTSPIDELEQHRKAEQALSDSEDTDGLANAQQWQRLSTPAEGLKRKEDFAKRRGLERSNFFPQPEDDQQKVSSVKAAVKSSSKPKFLVELELKIESELAALSSMGGSTAARARIFLEAAQDLGAHLPTYNDILSTIVRELSTALQYSESSVLGEMSSRREFDELKRKYDTDTAHLRLQLKDYDKRLKEELNRIDYKMKSRSMVMLIYENEELTKHLETARSTVHELQEKLGATNRVRAEFERTVRSIEDTFTLINDEKDLQISKLRTEAAMEHAAAVSTRNQARDEIGLLTDKLDAVEITYDVASKQNQLLTTRCRDLENHLNMLVQQLQVCQTERDAMEERLAAFEGNPTIGVKDPSTTPRPSKVEATQRILLLGDPSQYSSTQALLAGIYEMYDQKSRQLEDAKQVLDYLEDAVTTRVAERLREAAATIFPDMSNERRASLALEGSLKSKQSFFCQDKDEEALAKFRERAAEARRQRLEREAEGATGKRGSAESEPSKEGASKRPSAVARLSVVSSGSSSPSSSPQRAGSMRQLEMSGVGQLEKSMVT